MPGRLEGKRALVTCADRYMGPAIAELFAAEGAEVVTDTDPLTDPAAPARVVAAAGRVDILVANLAVAPIRANPWEIADADWLALFDGLVHPLMRLVRLFSPRWSSATPGRSSPSPVPPRCAASRSSPATPPPAVPERLHPLGWPRSRARQRAGQRHRPELRRKQRLLPARTACQHRNAAAHGRGDPRRPPREALRVGRTRSLPRLRQERLHRRAGHPFAGGWTLGQG